MTSPCYDQTFYVQKFLRAKFVLPYTQQKLMSVHVMNDWNIHVPVALLVSNNWEFFIDVVKWFSGLKCWIHKALTCCRFGSSLSQTYPTVYHWKQIIQCTVLDSWSKLVTNHYLQKTHINNLPYCGIHYLMCKSGQFPGSSVASHNITRPNRPWGLMHVSREHDGCTSCCILVSIAICLDILLL